MEGEREEHEKEEVKVKRERKKHTLIGASNSNKIGCEMKISLAFVQR